MKNMKKEFADLVGAILGKRWFKLQRDGKSASSKTVTAAGRQRKSSQAEPRLDEKAE
jgi:hypothetical protein